MTTLKIKEGNRMSTFSYDEELDTCDECHRYIPETTEICPWCYPDEQED